MSETVNDLHMEGRSNDRHRVLYLYKQSVITRFLRYSVTSVLRRISRPLVICKVLSTKIVTNKGYEGVFVSSANVKI